MRQDRQPVTIYEVADRAGVSIATVSRALRGSNLVALATRQHVQEIAEELQFRPNHLGRSLAEGQHAANGIVFPDLSGPYYAEVVLGYEEVAAELGRSVLILATHDRPEPVAKVLDLARRVDGMAILGRTVDDAVVARIADSGLPLVLLARPPVCAVDTIMTDNDTSSQELVRHLLGHGYRRLAYVGSHDESPDVAGRYAAFRRSLEAAGLAVREPVDSAFNVAAGHAAARRVLAGRRRPEAMVCANDEIALGAREAAVEAGLAVPGDVAITGWDDVMAARYAGLTTVRQPMRTLGATAATWLQERITRSDAPVRREVLRTQLVIRSSCGFHEPVEVEE